MKDNGPNTIQCRLCGKRFRAPLGTRRTLCHPCRIARQGRHHLRKEKGGEKES